MGGIFSSVFGTRSSRARNHTAKKQRQLNNAFTKTVKANLANNMDDFYRTKTLSNPHRSLTKWQQLQRKGGNFYDYLKHGRTRTNHNRIKSARNRANKKYLQKAINLKAARIAEQKIRNENPNLQWASSKHNGQMFHPGSLERMFN